MVPPDKRRLSMVFQSYAVWPHKTVFENLAYGLRLRAHGGGSDAHAASREALEMRAPRQALAERYPSELSGGQQQRVALARALVLEPRAPAVRRAAVQPRRLAARTHALRDQGACCGKLGITGIYVTHDQDEAMVMCRPHGGDERGRIEQLGTPEQIYHASRTAFVAGFVGLANCSTPR